MRPNHSRRSRFSLIASSFFFVMLPLNWAVICGVLHSLLSSHEAKLLQVINRGLPADVENRYNALQSKIHDGTITPVEHPRINGFA